MTNEDKVHIFYFISSFNSGNMMMKEFSSLKDASDYLKNKYKDPMRLLEEVNSGNIKVIVGKERKISIKETKVINEIELV